MGQRPTLTAAEALIRAVTVEILSIAGYVAEPDSDGCAVHGESQAALPSTRSSKPLEAEVLEELQRRVVPEMQEGRLVEVLQALEDALGDRLERPT